MHSEVSISLKLLDRVENRFSEIFQCSYYCVFNITYFAILFRHKCEVTFPSTYTTIQSQKKSFFRRKIFDKVSLKLFCNKMDVTYLMSKIFHLIKAIKIRETLFFIN